MSERHARWELVGASGDPVPADRWDVQEVREDYRSRASRLGHAVDVLDRLSRLDGWTGEAAEKFASQAHDRVGDLRKVVERYEGAADALAAYADAVASARTRTWGAVQDAEEADHQIRQNSEDTLVGVADPTPEAVAAQLGMDRRRDAAEQALTDARRRVDDAVADLAAAASTCASRIRTASESFQDRFRDDVKGVIRDIAPLLEKLIKVLEVLAAIVAFVVLVLVIVASAPFALIAVGIGLAVAIAAIRTMLASVGEATWGEVAWDLANVALSVTGLRVAGSMARSLEAGTAAVVNAQKVAAASRIPGVVRALSSVRMPGLRWVGRSSGSLGRAIGRYQGRRAERQVLRTLADLKPSASQTMRVADRVLARDLMRINHLRSYGVEEAVRPLAAAARSGRQLTALSWYGLYSTVDSGGKALTDAAGWGVPTPLSQVPGLLEDGRRSLVDQGVERAWRREVVP